MKMIELLILSPLPRPHTLRVAVIIRGSDLANLHDGLLHLYAHGWRHFEQALDQRVGRLVVSPRVDQQPVVQRLHTDQRCPPCLLRPVCKLGVVIKLEESQTPFCVRSHEKAKVSSVRPPLTWGTSGGPADTGAAGTGRVPSEGTETKCVQRRTALTSTVATQVPAGTRDPECCSCILLHLFQNLTKTGMTSLMTKVQKGSALKGKRLD